MLVLHYLLSGVIFHNVQCKPLKLKTGLWSCYIVCHYQDKLGSIIFATALQIVADCYLLTLHQTRLTPLSLPLQVMQTTLTIIP